MMTSGPVPLSLYNSFGESIPAELYKSSADVACPAILILHGFRVHMHWGFYPTLCEELASAGAHVLIMNFSRNGYSSEQSKETFDLETFASNTVSHELHDACSVVHALSETDLLTQQCAWNGEVHVLGHSRGAGIALLLSQRFSAIKRLCLWSALSNFDQYSERQKKLWRERGSISAPASTFGPAFRLDLGYLEDIEKNQEEYSLTDVISTCHIPVRLIVGEQDMATPPSESQRLFDASVKEHCSLTIIEHTGHTFGTSHPFNGTTEAFEKAVRLTRELFGLTYY